VCTENLNPGVMVMKSAATSHTRFAATLILVASNLANHELHSSFSMITAPRAWPTDKHVHGRQSLEMGTYAAVIVSHRA
jgi:hypothetical protein